MSENIRHAVIDVVERDGQTRVHLEVTHPGDFELTFVPFIKSHAAKVADFEVIIESQRQEVARARADAIERIRERDVASAQADALKSQVLELRKKLRTKSRAKKPARHR